MSGVEVEHSPADAPRSADLPTGPSPPAGTAPVPASPGAATADNAPAEPGRPSEPEIVDVWSRTQPKYRVRAVILLAINFVLFCGLCTFAHWLHFARAFDFSPASYYLPFKFWDAGAPNLNDFILAPINVVDVPVHAGVLGLVLAVIIAVPIVVAILYRFVYALPFLLALFVFAHMPWMAITLLGSCILAAVRPFRMKFRYGSALLGLLPVLVYLYLATRGTPELLANYGSPVQKMLLVAPWVIAILGAAVMAGIVLLLAKLVRYRPGAVAPVLGVMFAVPVVLFHLGVGRDELAYRILEAEYGPRSKCFAPVLKSRETQDAIWALIYKAIGNRSIPGQLRSDLLGLWSLRPEKFREIKRTVSRKFLASFLEDRARAAQACEQFIADHPESRYVPNVLYMLGRILDTRLDEARLADVEPARELYTGFPHAAAEEAWLTLFRRYPSSPFAVEAALRLGQLRLRDGKVDEALQYLRFAMRPGTAPRPPTAQPQTGGLAHLLLKPAAPESTLDFQPEPYRQEACQLAELIEADRDDPRYGNKPLAELARLDPRRSRYRVQLLALAQAYAGARLYDNLIVRWSASQPDLNQRVADLEACVRTFVHGDAIPEALYRLAEIETQALAAKDEPMLRRGVQRLREIVRRFPDTCWADLARQRLTVLQPPAGAGEGTP